MLQTPPSICAKCNTPLGPGQRFCPNCGATVSETIPPTMAASQPSNPYNPPLPTVAASQPSNPYNTPFPTVAASQSSPSNPYNMPFPPVGSSPSTSPNPYAPPLPTVAASQPSNPYNMPFPPVGSSPSTSPNPVNPYAPPPPSNPGEPGGYNAAPPPPPYMPPAAIPNSAYGVPQGYAPGQQNFAQPAPFNPYTPAGAPKKTSPLLIIGIIAAVVLVIGGSIWVLAKGQPGSSTATGGGNDSQSFAKSQALNLTMIYSSDQMTFTSLQQASKFSDDTYTSDTYSDTQKNFVRISFKEQQTANRSSYFSYRTAFLLLLPDKTTVTPLNAQEYSGPEQGVIRTNWVDFQTNAPIDLSKLSLRIGATDEAQMTVALQTGTDVSKYQPKTTTLDKPFNYATMNWMLQKGTQSYYFNGTQAKTGKVYVTVNLKADNTGGNTVYFYSGFVHLKSGDTVSAPDYASNLSAFDNIDPGTTNVLGTATFLVPPSNTYTLEFLAGKGFDAQQIDFSILN